jgi:hypothetical protein
MQVGKPPNAHWFRCTALLEPSKLAGSCPMSTHPPVQAPSRFMGRPPAKRMLPPSIQSILPTTASAQVLCTPPARQGKGAQLSRDMVVCHTVASTRPSRGLSYSPLARGCGAIVGKASGVHCISARRQHPGTLPLSHHMSLPAEPVSPKAAPLPPLPSEDPLTPEQWKTLLAIADAVVPAVKPMSLANAKTEVAITDNEYSTAVGALIALVPESDPDAHVAAKDYLAENASSSPEFQLELQRMFAMYMPQSTKKQLGMILNVLK